MAQDYKHYNWKPVQLSVIIPTWTGNQELADMAYELCQRVRPDCDELIVTEDADVYDERLHKISDVYVMHPNLGFTRNVNLGLHIARGDYMAVINSDVKNIEGNIRDLCIPDKVVSPVVRHMTYVPYFHGAFFVIPRTVLEDPRYGYLDCSQRDHDSDISYQHRTIELFQYGTAVKVDHVNSSRSFHFKNNRDRQERYIE